MEVRILPLVDAESIWLAYLSPAPVEKPLDGMPQDDLAALLSHPSGAVPDARFPDGRVVTMLFLHDADRSTAPPDRLLAEGVVGSSYLTVRRPLAPPFRDVAPAVWSGLGIADQVVFQTEGGVGRRVAFAHYHMSGDLGRFQQHRYALARVPDYLETFLDGKPTNRPGGVTYRMTAGDGLRVVIENPNLPGNPTPNPAPCVKMGGVIEPDEQGDGEVFTVDTVMLVPY